MFIVPIMTNETRRRQESNIDIISGAKFGSANVRFLRNSCHRIRFVSINVGCRRHPFVGRF